MKAFDLDRLGGRRFLDALLGEVLAAGEEARRLFSAGAAARARRKPDRSPVTEADVAVERRLHDFLERACPDAAFLGEESAPGEWSATHAGLRFIVDPIDGTRAFMRGLDSWGILIGLEDDGDPVLGIVNLPAREQLFVGVRGAGAYKNGAPIRVSQVDVLADAAIAHGQLAQFAEQGVLPLLPRLATDTYTQRGISDAYAHTLVLDGTLDAMIDPGVKPWDLCAVVPILEEAGGRFSDFFGARTVHGGCGLASNGLVHGELLELVRGT